MTDQEREELQFEILSSIQELNELVKKLDDEEPMIIVFGDKQSPRLLNPFATVEIKPVWQPKRKRKEMMN